ncbi:MAG TPA: NADH-quinone oxidoreductase subunit NuoH [Desulfobulbaceae bacterium]|nr:NADH-quinone oxidoreductase subunit NuoH [Desulfobulbaceae bacterium]
MNISLLSVVGYLVAIAALVGLNAVILVWLERKVAGHMQFRLGPMEVGPHGILQTLADGIKLVSKQLVIPDEADKPLFLLAPIVSLVPIFAAMVPLPFSETVQAWELNIGLLLIIALGLLNTLGILLAGWGSNNKYALLGGARAVAQILAYKIPLLICVMTIIMMTGSFSLRDIAIAQKDTWNVLYQPILFIVYIITVTLETNRSPFDFSEAESELVAGFHTEYSGMGFSLFFLAEYSYMFIAAGLATVLFLGGWHGPWLPGVAWTLIKIYSIIFLMMWFRWTFPRVRIDQMLSFGWKILLPLSLINFIITAGVLAL